MNELAMYVTWCIGWTVDEGAVLLSSTDNSTETSTGAGAAGDDAQTLNPDVLVSLTAPKRCSRRFRGRSHFVVQRFVPPELLRKYALGTAHVDAAVSLFVELSLVELDASFRNAANTGDSDQPNDE